MFVNRYLCIQVCKYTGVYVYRCVCIRVCMYTGVYVYRCVCIDTVMYVCTHHVFIRRCACACSFEHHMYILDTIEHVHMMYK